MHITSLGLPDFKSGVATSRRASLDFFSRRLPGAGGPFEDTKKKKTAGLYFYLLNLFNYVLSQVSLILSLPAHSVILVSFLYYYRMYSYFDLALFLDISVLVISLCAFKLYFYIDLIYFIFVLVL